MAEIKRSTLFGKLNPLGYKSIEAATIFCKMRGNVYVETAHWLHQLLQQPDSDVLRITQHFGLDASRLAADLIATLDRLPRGATAISDFSPHIEAALQQAYLYGSLLYGEGQIRTGHLIVAFLKTDSIRNVFLGLSREFTKIKTEQLSDDFLRIVGGSPEDAMRSSDGSGLSSGASPGETSGALAPAEMGKQEALKRFTTDLTEKVRKGEIDPIIGRDDEIRQCVDILMRRRQNNPILTGEAGVGKTAVVEGFAHRIVSGDVPPALKVELRQMWLKKLPFIGPTRPLLLLSQPPATSVLMPHRLCFLFLKWNLPSPSSCRPWWAISLVTKRLSPLMRRLVRYARCVKK